MEIILKTSKGGYVVKTVFFADSQEFGTLLEYPDGSQQVFETFKSVLAILEVHQFWCKFTGLDGTSINSSQVKMHLTTVA